MTLPFTTTCRFIPALKEIIMKVREVMTHPVIACGPDNNLAEAVKIMWDADCGAVPIVAEDRTLIGMITDRDIAITVGTQNRLPSDIRVADAMSDAIYSCTPDQDIHSALTTMRSERVRRLPVINNSGQLEGLLSVNDIALRAEKAEGAQTSGLSYDDVVSTLRAICEHRTANAATESRSAAG
jgi:CBS domain-containing protein